MDYQIYSFGNGEVLKGVFNAIALCLNAHSGSLYVPLVRIGILIGATLALFYAIYGNTLRAIAHWILPMVAIMQVLFVPQATVWILDPVSRYHQKVDHVPYGLAMIASTISQIGYELTKQIEKVFVLPDELKYQQSGTLFASSLIQQARTFHITHEDLAENMRQFVGQCVAYDVLLGRKYTLEDLRHSADIWGLVSESASPARAFLWRTPRREGRSSQTEIVSCREGIALFNEQWSAELDRVSRIFGRKLFGSALYPKTELLKYLPLAYGQLANLSQSATDLLKQNLMIYAVVDGLEQKSVALGNTPNFAVRRAYLQQRSTYETLGAMASDMLPTMKSVLEAIGYASFLFVIPLALLPSGFRFLSSWIQILLWLQMWAPLYAILNYIMTLAARSQSIAALSLSNKDGVTLASSVGLSNVNADIAAMSGYLSMSIPFLCIALVKGLGSFVHLASHLSNVTQGAAHSAASEMVSGNYSLGNISEGNRQLSNTSQLSQGYGASFRSGAFQQSDGRSEVLTGADGQQILNIASSNIPLSINVAETKAAQLSELASESYQKANSKTENAAKSFTGAYQHLVNLNKQLSKGQQFSDQVSEGKTTERVRAIQKATQLVEKFAHDNELDFQAAVQLLGEVSAKSTLAVEGSASVSGPSGKASIGKTTAQSKASQATSRDLEKAPRSLQKTSRDLEKLPRDLEKTPRDLEPATTSQPSYEGAPWPPDGPGMRLPGVALKASVRSEVGSGGSVQMTGTQIDRDTYDKAEALAKSQEFQAAMRSAKQAASALSHTVNSETIRKSAENFSGSYEEASHFRTEAAKSFRAAEDYQKQATHTQTFASSINANYTQEFVDWLAGQKADNTGGTLGKQGAGQIIANEPQLRLLYAQRFLTEKGLAVAAPLEVAKHEGKGDKLEASYDNDTTTAVNPVTREAIHQVRGFIESEDLHWDHNAAQALRQKVTGTQAKRERVIEQSETRLDNQYKEAGQVFKGQHKKSFATKFPIRLEHPSLVSPSPEPTLKDKDE